MGSLRKEPIGKSNLSEDEYSHYSVALKEARGAAIQNHVYWDLDKGENPTHVRKAFLTVARGEGIAVAIRKARGVNSLSFSFKSTRERLSAGECRRRIVNALKLAGRPMQKSEIISRAGISPSTWNLRIRELLADREVVRTGERRDTHYRLRR